MAEVEPIKRRQVQVGLRFAFGIATCLLVLGDDSKELVGIILGALLTQFAALPLWGSKFVPTEELSSTPMDLPSPATWVHPRVNQPIGIVREVNSDGSIEIERNCTLYRLLVADFSLYKPGDAVRLSDCSHGPYISGTKGV